MTACICSDCKNLKSTIDETDSEENLIVEECEFGFPSEDCTECEAEGCDLKCEHYVKADSEKTTLVSKCTRCGKAVEVITDKEDGGAIYCIDCFLNK